MSSGMSSSPGCERAVIIILGKMVIVKTEKGGKAIVGLHNLCSIAKRLGICIDNYKC